MRVLITGGAGFIGSYICEKSNIVHGKIVHTSDTHSIGQTISRVV